MRETTTARRPYVTGVARRAQIVATAFEAFRTQGFHGASLLQIATACGVSRTGLIHHFPTKEDLLRAVLEERDRQDHERFSPVPDGGVVDGREYVIGLDRLIRHNVENRGIVSLFVVLSAEATDPDHPAHAYFRARYERTRATSGAAFADLARRGLVRTERDAADLAEEFVALLDGIQLQWLYRPQSIDMVAHYRRWVNGLLTVDLL